MNDILFMLMNDLLKEFKNLKKFIKKSDISLILKHSQILNPKEGEVIAKKMLDCASNTLKERSEFIDNYFSSLPPKWYFEPFYYTYVQFFGAPKDMQGTFSSLLEMLTYLENIGIKNIYILPHYESPMLDNGYDVSDFKPAKTLGGIAGYEKFIKAAINRGFRVVTDAVFNHTSTDHVWFKKALAGDPKYMNYYLDVSDWEKIEEKNVSGDIRVTYKDSENNFMERTLIFPDITRVHYIEKNINNKKVKFYCNFYPFQVDLNLQNPDVLEEIWKIIGEEANSGIVGKRTDAIAHWLKPKGSFDADGNPETFALHTLFKIFLKIVSPKAIIIPEAVRSIDQAKMYIGESIKINSVSTTSQGDAMFNFHAQGSLRESLCFEISSPWWEYWGNHHQQTNIPSEATWINLLSHHDEIYMGFIRKHYREAFRRYIAEPNLVGGYIFKEGMSGGARIANCLLNDKKRIAMAFFMLYMIPGVPAVYYGDEICQKSNLSYAKKRQKEVHENMKKNGFNLSIEKFFDPRELHRGKITKTKFITGLKSKTAQTIKKLNSLWNNPVVRSPHLHDLPCDDNAIIAMEKYLNNHHEGINNPPIIALANLSGTTRKAKIPLSSFNKAIQTINKDVIEFKVLIDSSLKLTKTRYKIINDEMFVELKKYEFILLAKA